MKPSDLAIHSNIAQGKVYSVLDDLERNKGPSSRRPAGRQCTRRSTRGTS